MNKKVLSLFKNELRGKIITEFVALRPKAYAYLNDDGNEHTKRYKKVCNKTKNLFQNFKECLLNNKFIYRLQERFKSYNHDVCKEEVNKIA